MQDVLSGVSKNDMGCFVPEMFCPTFLKTIPYTIINKLRYELT